VTVKLIDSTTIALFLSMFDWEKFPTAVVAMIKNALFSNF